MNLVRWPRKELPGGSWCPVDGTLRVKRLFVLVQAWLCIHSWGLHFLEKPPTHHYHHPFLSGKSMAPHRNIPLSFPPYFIYCQMSPKLFHLPVLGFQRELAYDCTRGLREGVGLQKEPDTGGWGTKKGLRYSV